MDRVDAVKAEMGCTIKIMGIVNNYTDGRKTYDLYALCETVEGGALVSIKPMNFVDGEESLTLTIDGEANKFKGEKSACEKKHTGAFPSQGTWYRSEAYYPVDANLLQKIRDAKEVKFELTSNNGSLLGKFPQGLQKQFGEFCKYCGI